MRSYKKHANTPNTPTVLLGVRQHDHSRAPQIHAARVRPVSRSNRSGPATWLLYVGVWECDPQRAPPARHPQGGGELRHPARPTWGTPWSRASRPVRGRGHTAIRPPRQARPRRNRLCAPPWRWRRSPSQRPPAPSPPRARASPLQRRRACRRATASRRV